MNTFFVNNFGDLELDGQNNIRMIDGKDEKVQAVRLLLQTNKGEWFLNTEHGLGYYEILGQKNPSEELIRSLFQETFNQEPRIEEVLEFSFEIARKQRKLTVCFKLRMDGEEIEGEEVI